MKLAYYFSRNFISRPGLYICAALVFTLYRQLESFTIVGYSFTLFEAIMTNFPMVALSSLGLLGIVFIAIDALQEAKQQRDVEVFLALEKIGNVRHASRYAISRFAS